MECANIADRRMLLPSIALRIIDEWQQTARRSETRLAVPTSGTWRAVRFRGPVNFHDLRPARAQS